MVNKPNKKIEGLAVHKGTGDDDNLNSSPPFIVQRSKEGLKMTVPISKDGVCKNDSILAITENKNDRIESICCSQDGELLAWCDNNFIRCIKFGTQEVIFEKQNVHKSNCITISPKSTKLISYSTMSGGDNLHFWDLSSQELLASMSFRKASQWKPVFSMNEDICIQHVNSELVLYGGGKFDKPKSRISHLKVNDFSLSSASFDEQTYQHLYSKRIKFKTHHVAIYTSGTKGQPSIVKIYKYPNMTDCITNKSFFKADRVKFSWSPSGNSLLLTCQADFDKSGKSYYGEQSLNFMSVKGDSYFVNLPKAGTISHLEWYPSCDKDMFICVHGLMPAKVSLFNSKCEVLFNFEDQGNFNTANFSPFGNMLAVYGFGNLAGQLCIWDFDKKKLISTLKVPETTGLEWCADGKHILTSTTTPRLRVGNGFRLWHYTGRLIYEEISTDPNQNKELYDVLWQPGPSKYSKPKCDLKPSELPNLLAESKLNKFQGSVGKYVPPSMRNITGPSNVSSIDSAYGLGAGNRPIVGLESLNRDKIGQKSNQRSKNKNKNTTKVKVNQN